ncbi:endonuclease domain-containing protein [Algoriphagus halophytocola]|uniref:endonuclease domain-containing protein n=1 Tax=Algoriphagus halophytocola TaxID=2991499 RepID=UPI0022DCF3D9|nr:endonuclease domain-containing protein [Algoriphagus sp. TR-M9]WBL41314.1 endonuclease domain-containing protein [Algoriphagus sp. TR-M9]
MSRKFNHKASPEIFRRARELREQMTPAERVLWEKLRANRLNGLHFRRQHPISKFIVDFYCHKFQLVIELDGEIHQEKDQQQRDKGREEDLQNLGLHILRFSNQDILHETQLVLTTILNEIERIKRL